jgi:hypothetical protein
MTNKDKIIRYLECGLKVNATSLAYPEDTPTTILDTHYNRDDHLCFVWYDNNEVISASLDFFEQHILIPIPLKPNYQPGDLVTILPIAREIDGYDIWNEHKKDMVDSGTYEVKSESLWDIAIYKKEKLDYWLFPSWAIAPAFPDEVETGEKAEKLKELEARIAEIQKEIEALKN